MSGFLAFLIFFGCILICAQMGFITAQPDERGRIVLFAGGQGARNLAVRIIRNNLLTQDQVMALDEEEFQQAEGEGEGEGEDSCCCAICLEEFADKEKVRVLPCKHRFHEDCLVPWLTERHSSCPLCKFDVMQHILNSQANGNEEAKQVGAASTESANIPVENYQDESPVSAPVSLWNHLWGFRGWTATTDDHQHQMLDTASSEEADEEMETSNAHRTTIVEIEMERRTRTSAPQSIAENGFESRPQP
jgi:RING-like zinc finger